MNQRLTVTPSGFIRFQMYALISWSSKNGVALGREELEVRSSTKLTVMNGGKMEPGAIVNMLFRKEIWGGGGGGARFNHSMVSSSVIYLTSLKLVTKFVNPSDLLAYCVACSSVVFHRNACLNFLSCLVTNTLSYPFCLPVQEQLIISS